MRKREKLDEDDRALRQIFKGFLIAWIIGAVLGLCVLGVAIWAVIQLVNWVTAQ